MNPVDPYPLVREEDSVVGPFGSHPFLTTVPKYTDGTFKVLRSRCPRGARTRVSSVEVCVCRVRCSRWIRLVVSERPSTRCFGYQLVRERVGTEISNRVMKVVHLWCTLSSTVT